MKQLPYFKFTGNYQEFGEFLGTNFRQNIQYWINHRKKTIPYYDSYLPKSKECLDITREHFPKLIIETEAIAKAAEVPLIDYFFMNNREVYDPAEEWDKQHITNPDHCTVVAGYDNNELIIGHNEDWSLDAINEFCILEATINDTSFIALHYMTVIPGPSASMNNHGLVQCINDIYQTNQIGVPKNYVARAILEAKSLDEAEKIIRSTPKASGFNHVLAQGNEVRNIEIAGDAIGVERIIEKPYVHTNHYLTPKLQKLEKFHTKSSEARYERASELLTNHMTITRLKSILSDTQNKEFPICRSDETIGSAIFKPSKREAYLCYGHPCVGTYIKHNLKQALTSSIVPRSL